MAKRKVTFADVWTKLKLGDKKLLSDHYSIPLAALAFYRVDSMAFSETNYNINQCNCDLCKVRMKLYRLQHRQTEVKR